jgi:Putative peptidoglycan binding domain
VNGHRQPRATRHALRSKEALYKTVLGRHGVATVIAPHRVRGVSAGAPTAVRPTARPLGPERPALDRLLTSGDIHVAQGRLRAFGFDQGPVDGIYTAQTQFAVRAFPIWPPRCQDCSITRRVKS